MQDCLFCKIARGEIPSNKVHESDRALAFYDISPQAPVHVVIIPKQHFASALDVASDNGAVLSAMHEAALAVAQKLNLRESGFRLVVNTGEDGGQTVGHLHMHLLAGRRLGWPPG